MKEPPARQTRGQRSRLYDRELPSSAPAGRGRCALPMPLLGLLRRGRLTLGYGHSRLPDGCGKEVIYRDIVGSWWGSRPVARGTIAEAIKEGAKAIQVMVCPLRPVG